MPLLINNECIACDACREECPTEAIEEGDPIYIIEPELCTECVGSYDEPNCIAVCPIDCIISDKDNSETVAELKYKYEKLIAEEEE